jgi:nitrate/TMAO reductase-like tetraheme cytochrome c subunit
MKKNTLLTYLIFMCLFILNSCGEKNSHLKFNDEDYSSLSNQNNNFYFENQKKLKSVQKEIEFVKINEEAKRSFESVREILSNKCMNCHDGNFKLPLYGRILKKINPVYAHQKDGLKAFDFGSGFPFRAQGAPPQLSILKSIKNSLIEKTMPIKSFTAIYPSKKVNDSEREILLTWLDTVIDNFETFEKVYNLNDQNSTSQAKQILELKCFRCHARGNEKGNFGGMENFEDLLNGKYVNIDSVESAEKTKTLYFY